MTKTTEQRTAFLTILGGGTGREAGRYMHELFEAEHRPFAMRLVQIDTDPQTAPYIDRAILIPLDGEKVETVKADPATFGDTVRQIVEHYPQLLNPEDTRNGARTIRLL